MRAYLVTVVVAAIALPIATNGLGTTAGPTSPWLAVLALVGVSVLNVELGRRLVGGVAHTHQPHKTLSAWAFSCALLAPPVALFVVVPLTYAHAYWRGLRLPWWKWVGSAAFVVLAGVAAAATRWAVLPHGETWMRGNGGHGVLVVLLAAVVFLAVESLLFTGSALLNEASDEVWLRRTLRSASFYSTEFGVLLVGGLLAAVWAGGAWFVLLFCPVYALVQRAALHEPLRERAETAAMLEARNRDLERANQFKIDLMGMLGHEIGTPLSAIEGFADVGAGALRDGRRALALEAFEVVERNAARVLEVRKEILDLVRSERGALTADPRPCPVEPILRAAVEVLPPAHRPLVACSPELVAIVQPGHLDQILANLLGNAEKYAGGATRLSARAVDGDRLEIVVEDAGPGVDPAFREHLFERYSRYGDTAQHVLGSGLGLFIARELARANGAEIAYRDVTGAGAVFVVTLRAGPLRDVPGQPMAVPKSRPMV